MNYHIIGSQEKSNQGLGFEVWDLGLGLVEASSGLGLGWGQYRTIFQSCSISMCSGHAAPVKGACTLLESIAQTGARTEKQQDVLGDPRFDVVLGVLTMPLGPHFRDDEGTQRLQDCRDTVLNKHICAESTHALKEHLILTPIHKY